MKTVVRLGLAACLTLLAMPGRAEDAVDTSQIFVKKAIADTMTPAQLQAYKERMARNLANRKGARVARRAAGGFLPNTPSNTCPTATPEGGPFPYSATGTTVGSVDDYDIAAPGINTCTGTSTACSGPPSGRGAVYSGTGTGPDRAYHIKTDANCALTITMTPTDTGPVDSDDLGLLVYQPTCTNLPTDCLCASDTGFAGDPETVTLTAVANTDYFLVIDGYASGGVPPGFEGPFTLGITTAGTCNLVGSGVYHTIAPCRLVDTRLPVGTYGGPALVAGTPRTFDVDAGACSIPATASAIFVNVTAVDPAAAGNLRLWPTGTTFPTVSNLNFGALQTRGNNGIVKLDASRSFDIQSNQNTHVLIDVAGYFEE